MLPLGELDDAVAKLSWLPGWRLIVTERRSDHHPVLLIAGTAPNSYRPDEITDLHKWPLIPPMETVGHLHEWVYVQLMLVAQHEAAEWFRKDGRPVFDPH